MIKEKRKIPQDIQKKMMNYFLRTSIPRKKAFLKNKENKSHLPTNEEGR